LKVHIWLLFDLTACIVSNYSIPDGNAITKDEPFEDVFSQKMSQFFSFSHKR